MKKEFTSYWTPECMSPMSLRTRESDFFDRTYSTPANRNEERAKMTAVLPDNITYLDLLPFVGKKTRITIEVVD